MIRNRSGRKATCESIQEEIYPTEFESAQISNAVGEEEEKGEGEAKNAAPAVTSKATGLSTPATPDAFETRNTGFTLEIEPTLSADHKIVDLRLMPEHVIYAGRAKWEQCVSDAETPEFESQTSIQR